ncbi:MAG TPA: sigma-70 family RNA polymerase sigma factor [Nannocystaceae bacterium]|nr:sigma-70 family RNA polymerase sigma factor [Nannocystaceae bacterium]
MRVSGIGDSVDRAVGGHDRSARALVRRLTPLVRARVRRALAREGACLGVGDADDVVQQVMLELFADHGRRLRAYDPERGVSLAGWVGMVADRQITDLARRSAAQKRGGPSPEFVVADELPSASAGPEDVAVAIDLAKRLIDHLDRSLPSSGRAVLDGVFANGRTIGEVAADAGLTRQVVYNWQHRIRVAVRAFMSASATEK